MKTENKTMISIAPEFSKRLVAENILRNAADANSVKRAYIPLAMLEFADYQRPCQANRVREIASKWDDYKANEVVVSYRDGSFFVVDGQHTVRAAEMVGKSDLYCKIYEDLSFEEEAKLFVQLNNIQVRVSTVQKYKAMVCAKDPETMVLENLCKEFSIVTIPTSSHDKPVLGGMRAAQGTLRICGEMGLRWAFEVIRDSQWHMEPGAYSELMLMTLRSIYKTHIGELAHTKTKLCAILKKVPFGLLRAKANISYIGRGNSSALIALLESYLCSEKNFLTE